MTLEKTSSLRQVSRSSLSSFSNSRKSWSSSGFSSDGLDDTENHMKYSNDYCGYGQPQRDTSVAHRNVSDGGSPAARRRSTSAPSEIEYPRGKIRTNSKVLSRTSSKDSSFKSENSEQKSTSSPDKGVFDSLRRLSLGCGLGGFYHRRRLLVAPVSRSPSQELSKPRRLVEYDDITSQKDQQQFDQSVPSAEEWLPWPEKYQPRTLGDFISQTQTAFHLKHLISQGNCPHMLVCGPPGSGKRSLIRAMLQDLYGPDLLRIGSPTCKSFSVQGGRLPNFLVPVVTSEFHMEIDVCSLGDFDVEILPAVIREISYSCSSFQDNSAYANSDGFYKVLVVYRADRLSKDAKMVLRRCMDKYGDTCKVILNSSVLLQGDHALEDLQSHCHFITVGPPTIDEIVKVLQYITQQEKLDLPIGLATRIAVQSKRNLKQAIISLEACRTERYPFLDDQSIEFGYWEKDIMKIAVDIISEPTPKQLFIVRPNLQALLMNSVPASLILQKLLEELVHNLGDPNLVKEITHWAQHFESKVTAGPECMYQLEGFVTKFMSIYKKYLNSVQEQYKCDSQTSYDQTNSYISL